jgi:putative nucleotidyltransferase with HDIG domain
VRQERKHLELVRAIAFTNGVARAADSGSSADLRRLIDPLAANSQAERVEVLDRSGHRVFGLKLLNATTLTYAGLTKPDDRASWTIVADVLARKQDALGDKFAQLVQTPDGYVLYTAGPIYDGSTLAGVVLVGTSLDTVLAAVKTEALADVTFYGFDGTPLRSTFPATGDGGEANLTPGATDFLGSTGQAVREQKTLYGRGFDLLYGRLIIRDQEVGAYSVGLPSSFILSASATTRWQLSALFTLAVLAVLLIGSLVAHNLTRPLMKLVTVARAAASGDLTARSSLTSVDEVGVLGTSLDHMTEQLQQQHLRTIRALTAAIDARDPYTLGHSARVGQLAVMLGNAMGLPEQLLQHLEIGGYLHDIGKIGVRDSVLLKPGALTEEEREFVEQHPRIGLEILAPVDLAPEVIQFVGGHHEKLDGSGYPAQLRGDHVSMIARIASVADMYDALTTDRPYRAAMTMEQALEILLRDVADGHLDAAVVNTFASIVEDWERRRTEDPSLKGYRIPGWTAEEAA